MLKSLLAFFSDVIAAFFGGLVVVLVADWWIHRVRIDGQWNFLPKGSGLLAPQGQRPGTDTLFLVLNNRNGRRAVTAVEVVTKSGESIRPLIDRKEVASSSPHILGWHLEPTRQRAEHLPLSSDGAKVMRSLDESCPGGYRGKIYVVDQSGKKHRIARFSGGNG